MSSTTQPKRGGSDFYTTPPWAVDQILDALDLEDVSTWVDLGCGSGAIGSCLRKRYPNALGIGVEIEYKLALQARDAGVYTRVWCTDFRSYTEGSWRRRLLSENLPLTRKTIVVANPPFNRAVEFIETALDVFRDSPALAFLLRLGFLEGTPQSRSDVPRQRDALLRREPFDLYPFSKRVSFTGGGTDSCPYGWFLWGQGLAGGRCVRLPFLRGGK